MIQKKVLRKIINSLLIKIDEKDKKKKTSSYTGGEKRQSNVIKQIYFNKKSGLAVENPEDKKAIMDILNQAQKNSESKQPQEKSEVNCRIKLYGNGFIIDDGDFRDYNEPKNKQFMAELKQNQVPSELRQKFPKGIQVGIEDRTDEKYVPPPPPKYVQFSGSGVSIGDSAPIKTQQQQQQNPIYQPKQNQQQQQQQRPLQQFQQPKPKQQGISIDSNKPTTQILVRLQDGQNITLTVNLETKVREIYNYIRGIVSNGVKEIKLIAGFPPKQITLLDQTVEEADLMDSQINQS